MPDGSVQNYQGAVDAGDMIQLGINKWIKVYNDTAADLTDGDIVIINYSGKVATNTLAPNARVPATVASPVNVWVGVMATWAEQIVAAVGSGGAATVVTPGVTPIGSYGWAQISGYCAKVAVPASTATNRLLKATNGTKVATDVAIVNDDGVTGLTEACFGSTKTTDTGATCFTDAVLFGRQVTI